MDGDDKDKGMTEAHENDEDQTQLDEAEELNSDEGSDHVDTAEELVKKKADNIFKASGNLANIQIFMQNADFKDGTELRQILNLASKHVNDDRKYDLEKEDDCADFFHNCKNKDYITLAIMLSVFEIVATGDIINLKDTLVEYLPPVFRLNEEGKEVFALQTNPYLSLNDVLSVIQGKIFVTKEGQQCIGYGKKSTRVLRNIWIQFPALRKPIVMWLLKVNDTFEYRTTFEAYQMTTAFVRIISEDFSYAKKQIFERLYSNSKNLGLLARLAHELQKKDKNRNDTLAMVLKWAESDSHWLWKAAILVYLYAKVPFQDRKLENALTLTVKKKVLGLQSADLKFIAVYAGHFEKMRSFMADIFSDLSVCEKTDNCAYLALIYLCLVKYGYYIINKDLVNLPFVVCDSKKQIANMAPVLAYIMTRYDLRCQLYSILRVYLEEIAGYDVPQGTIKHVTAYFYTLAQNDDDYQKDILLFLKESCGEAAKSVYLMLKDIYKGGKR